MLISWNLQCRPGYYSANGRDNPELCAAATPGHFVDTTGATSQTDCALGYFAANSAQVLCDPAEVGYYVDTTAASSPTACPAGMTTAAIASDSLDDCYRPAPTADPCQDGPFNDVATDHPFCPEIDWMKDANVTTGFGDGSYRPAAYVTRQAMAAFIARLAQAQLLPCAGAPFTDVAVDHPFCPEIKWMADNGISTGFEDGSYRPGENITRQAMAAFMARVALATPGSCTSQRFTDVAVDHPFCPEINWVWQNGISTGYGDGSYQPDAFVTRQAMAAFMFRLNALLAPGS